MSKLIDTINKLPDDQRNIFDKYMGVMSVCEDQIDEKLHFAELHNILMKTLKGSLRYLAMDLEEIKNRFEIYQKAGFEDIITNSPELIRFNPNTILERISLCQKVGKPFKVDNRYASFLFDDKLWSAVERAFDDDFEKTSLNEYPEINPDEWTMKKDMDDVVYKAFNYAGPLDFDENSYDKYIKAAEIIKGVKEAIGSNPDKDTMSLPIATDELITRLIKVEPNLSERMIAKYCLQYCDGLVDGVDPIIDAVCENVSEEKRGL